MRKSLLLLFLLLSCAYITSAQHYTELLNRAAVAMGIGRGGQYISWRSLISDSPDMYFDIYRDGSKINSAPIADCTCFADPKGKSTNKYVIKAMVGEDVVEEFDVRHTQAAAKLHLDRPEGGVNPKGESYTYTPNDCSVGDVDGDGDYEIILKWDPSNSKDNSQGGYTGNVILDCYKLDGSRLWRIDLGVNIRAGAHYTQFMVYDFDGDGRAEMICKTAPGSKDNSGSYVSEAADLEEIRAANNTKDWRNSEGRIDGGQEWLTVFDGQSGNAIHTIYYNPNRNTTVGGESKGTFNWDDRANRNDYASYGNRGERHLACVAYLGGKDALPSAVMVRGYYTYAFLWAVDFDGERLSTRWLHSSKSTTQYTVTDSEGQVKTYTAAPATKGSGSRTAYSNGNHNLSVGDVDGDGRDEIIWGSCAIDDDGKVLYATGYGHGDAIHLGKMIPGREGLQVYQVHEASPYGWDLHDAATGEIIYSATADGDTGRGCAADIDPKNDGYEMWCSADRNPRSTSTGKKVVNGQPSMNFRIYWDGDLQDELLDGNKITKWDGTTFTTLASLSGSSCNGTKSTPNLQADILGDWREEVILWDSGSNSDLYIHSTTIASDHKVPCLMQDHQYRLAVAWQNVAYNQPPHLGYYLPDGSETSGISSVIADACTGLSTIYSASSGIKVATSDLQSLTPGLYIILTDGKASKVYVR